MLRKLHTGMHVEWVVTLWGFTSWDERGLMTGADGQKSGQGEAGFKAVSVAEEVGMCGMLLEGRGGRKGRSYGELNRWSTSSCGGKTVD